MAWYGFVRAPFFSYVPHSPAGPHSPGKAENSVVFFVPTQVGVSQRTFRSTFQFKLTEWFQVGEQSNHFGVGLSQNLNIFGFNCWIVQVRVLHCLNGGGLMMKQQVYRLMALVTHIIFW
jgi:hypothetical protein